MADLVRGDTARDPRRTDLAAGLEELAGTIERIVGPDAPERRLGRVWALRRTRPTEPSYALYGPMLCVVAQGAKQLSLGDERCVYDAGRFMLNSVTVPAAGGVIEATEAHPCLWTMIELDPAIVSEVVVAAGLTSPPIEAPMRTMEASPIDASTLDAVVRLVRIFDAPRDAPYLAPLLEREIVYRLLTGTQGARLRQVAGLNVQAQKVIRAVDWLRRNFDKPMSIEALAREANVSASALHHGFKKVTAMSPLQYQRQMRLQEARRLMMGEGLDAASAGSRVGYDDPSYFSREYRRFFGDPPRRHVARLREDIAR